MANKEFSNVYQIVDFCNNIRTYCFYVLFFRQLKIVVVTETDCINYPKNLLKYLLKYLLSMKLKYSSQYDCLLLLS